MQQRESAVVPRDPVEALLSRSDEAALDYVTDRLLAAGGLDDPPAVQGGAPEPVFLAAG